MKMSGVLGNGAVTFLIFALLLAGAGLIVFGFNILGDRAALAPLFGSIIAGVGFVVLAAGGILSVLTDIKGILRDKQG